MCRLPDEGDWSEWRGWVERRRAVGGVVVYAEGLAARTSERPPRSISAPSCRHRWAWEADPPAGKTHPTTSPAS